MKRPSLPALPVPAPIELYKGYGFHRRVEIMDSGNKKFVPILAGVSEGTGFENWEYRFWCVDLTNKMEILAQSCRACDAVFYNKNSRVAHMNNVKCTVKLTQAYQLLLRDKRCVICDTQTSRQMWGVPLCEADCQHAWCESTNKPDALEAALQLVEANIVAAQQK